MNLHTRPNGISLLIACQNEEATLAMCLLSFINFADEIIIVDNGSVDRSIEIAKDLKATFPKKILFFDAPHLADLHQVRQFGLINSQFRWIVRGDADFVAYNEGENDINTFRDYLLLQRRSILPKSFGAPLPNLICDFWHTGIKRDRLKIGINDPGRYVPPPVTEPNPRIYEYFQGFKFQRIGRWEITSFNRLLRFRRKKLPFPLWMHCNVKSNRDYLYRSERTNWRELGDFRTYPTLEDYLRDVIKTKYGVADIDTAAEMYMQTNVYPFLQKYDPFKYFPYPSLVEKQMESNPVYRIHKKNNQIVRDYYGIESFD